MQAQRVELLRQLPESGWRVTNEETNLDWWVDEMWQLESTWSPVGVFAYVTFLVDPMVEGNRKKGEAVWAVLASRSKPIDRRPTQDGFTLALADGWKENLPDFFGYLSTLARR